MAELLRFSADSKVQGTYVIALIESMGAFKPVALKTMEDNGVGNLTPEAWYDMAIFMKAFRAIADRFGGNTIAQIGKNVGEFAPFPPGIDGIEQGVTAIAMSYDMVHKGTDCGSIRVTKTGPKSLSVNERTPYPDEYERGVLASALQRFKKPGDFPKVVHDDTKPCKLKGGDSCTYTITW